MNRVNGSNPVYTEYRACIGRSKKIQPVLVLIPLSVFLFFLHDLIGPGQENRRPEEGHMDKDLAFDVLGIFIGNIDKGLSHNSARNL
jgi:hypothetical protein